VFESVDEVVHELSFADDESRFDNRRVRNARETVIRAEEALTPNIAAMSS
jgi:hypothetical protein